MDLRSKTRSAAKSKENETSVRSTRRRTISVAEINKASTVGRNKRVKKENLDSNQADSNEVLLKLKRCSLADKSPTDLPDDPLDDSSASFQTTEENSGSRLNLNNESAIETSQEDLEIPVLSKSAFDLQENYEELEELPNQYDYRNVRLKENVFIGYEEEKKSLNFLINTAIGRGESGTVLVFGGQGSGKTSFGKRANCLFLFGHIWCACRKSKLIPPVFLSERLPG